MSKSPGAKSMPLTRVEAFASRFTIEDNGCWMWNGYTYMGYARFKVNGKIKNAHRVIWELVGNPINFSLVLDHICENKACVNPKHLRQVTAEENASLSALTASVVNKAKTHCANGHKFSPENTYTVGTRRNCRPCIRASQKRLYWRRKEELRQEWIQNAS